MQDMLPVVCCASCFAPAQSLEADSERCAWWMLCAAVLHVHRSSIILQKACRDVYLVVKAADHLDASRPPTQGPLSRAAFVLVLLTRKLQQSRALMNTC